MEKTVLFLGALFLIASTLVAAFSEDAVRIEAYGASGSGSGGFATFYETARALDGLDCSGHAYASPLQCEFYKSLLTTYSAKYFPSRCADKISKEKFKLVLYYQLEKESRFRANAVNEKNVALGIIDSSYGIAQFTESTANWFGIGKEGAKVPEKAMEAQAKYMRLLMYDETIVKCDYKLALAAYNSGLRIVQSARGIPQNRYTPNYVLTISNNVEGGLPA